MKKFLLLIILLLFFSQSVSAQESVEVRHGRKSDQFSNMRFEVIDGGWFKGPVNIGVLKTATIRWRHIRGTGPAHGRHFWGEGHWGNKYIVDAFNLQNYSTSEKSVHVIEGKSRSDGKGTAYDETHYVPHKTQKKYCIVNLKSDVGSTAVDGSLIVLLLGCINTSLP